MSEQEILECNKLVADFILPSIDWHDSRLGKIKLYSKPGHDSPHCEARELKYRESWDWLMPVIKKINTVLIGCVLDHSFALQSRIERQLLLVNIETTWTCVVQFIKWYNQTPELKNKS